MTLSKATESDALFIGERLREADMEEVKAYGFWADGDIPKTVSNWANIPGTYIISLDGEPVVLYGLPDDTPWMVATDRVKSAQITLHKLAKVIVQRWQMDGEYLSNQVLASNEETINWLGTLGFNVLDGIVYPGVIGIGFRKFEWRREPCVCPQ